MTIPQYRGPVPHDVDVDHDAIATATAIAVASGDEVYDAVVALDVLDCYVDEYQLISAHLWVQVGVSRRRK